MMMPRKLALLITGSIAGVLLALAFVIATPASPTSADQSLDSEETAFITLINNYRAQHGLLPLSIDWKLQPPADWMSGDMGEKAYFSHTDSLGRDPWTRMCQVGGYCYNTYKGENIAAGFTTAQAVFDAWKASPGHNANMLGPNFSVMGIARVYTPGSPYTWYWTNDFGGAASGALPPAGLGPTPTPVPATPTRSPSPTPVRTASPTPVRTASPTPVRTNSPTPIRTPTPTPVRTASPTPVRTPTPTPIHIGTATPRTTVTPRTTTTPGAPRVVTPPPTTHTPTPTATPTHAPTPTPTHTPSPTIAPTRTPTATPAVPVGGPLRTARATRTPN
jgi:uncharacterized protein YkwD